MALLSRAERLRAVAILVGPLLGLATVARADGLSGLAQGTYAHTETSSTDQAGQTTRTTSEPWTGLFRLSFDRSLYPALSLSAGANYQLTRTSAVIEGVSTENDQDAWSAYGRLGFGDPLLNGSLSYNRRSEYGENRTAEDVLRSPTLVAETYGFATTWAPLDLPRLAFRASRNNSFDAQRQVFDSTSDELAIAATYQPIERLDLRYTLGWSTSTDHLHGVETSSVQNAGGATWGDNFLGGRAALNLAYNIGTTASSTSVTGTGGTVATQVFPIAGLSAVETPPTLPANVTLSLNPALVDNDTNGGAGLNVGYSPRLSADDRIRDVGVRLADAVTEVNTVYVWVDKPLPLAVSAAYTWTAYRSTDNLNWTEVPITAAVTFGEFQNRFEISIARTTAEYLKVTTRPLQPGVTTNTAFADVLVTEVQVLMVVPATEAAGSHVRTSGSFSSAARVRLLRTVNYDGAFSFTHGSGRGEIPWALQNGISWNDRLSRIVTGSARVERDDSSGPGGHTSEWRWSAALAADPLPTLSGGTSYGGRVVWAPDGRTLAHSFGVFSRQDLYPGVGATESAAYGFNEGSDGRRIQTLSFTASTSVTPHRSTAMSVSWSLVSSVSSGGTQPDQSSTSTRADASLSVNPVPALYFSGGVSYFTGGARPTTTFNGSATASPFSGGDLVFRISYTDSYDTVSDVRTRQLAPGVRWNLARVAFADLIYTWLIFHSPAQSVDTKTLSVSLTVRAF